MSLQRVQTTAERSLKRSSAVNAPRSPNKKLSRTSLQIQESFCMSYFIWGFVSYKKIQFYNSLFQLHRNAPLRFDVTTEPQQEKDTLINGTLINSKDHCSHSTKHRGAKGAGQSWIYLKNTLNYSLKCQLLLQHWELSQITLIKCWGDHWLRYNCKWTKTIPLIRYCWLNWKQLLPEWRHCNFLGGIWTLGNHKVWQLEFSTAHMLGKKKYSHFLETICAEHTSTTRFLLLDPKRCEGFWKISPSETHPTHLPL